jgi:hypothetical protein
VLAFGLFLVIGAAGESPAIADANASWKFDTIWQNVSQSVGQTIGLTSERERDELGDAERYIRQLKVPAPALVLAATVTGEGHWTFVNQSGQRYTAANPSEIKRVYRSLAPDIRLRPAPVVIHVTASSVFAHSEHLGLLPDDARLRLLIGLESFRLRAVGSGDRRTWFGEIAANVLVRAGERRNFVEAVWQLRRPLSRRSMRVLALDAGAPDTFRPIAVREANGIARQAIDAINPTKLVSALPTLRRQTAVITGRLDGSDKLVYRTSTAAEYTLDLTALKAVAGENDANLVFVNAAAPRQPGVRNWLWLRAEVDGLVDALRRRTLGDFFNALAGSGGRLFVEAREGAKDRIRLSVIPLRAGVLEGEPGTVASMIAELVSEVAGHVLAHAIDADMVSMARQQELDRRLLVGVPSMVQYVFGLAMLIGCIGLPVALSWWRRIWRPEMRAEYPNRAGFQAARLTRWLVFVALFLPIAGLPAVLWGIARGLAWLFNGGRRRERADAEAVSR